MIYYVLNEVKVKKKGKRKIIEKNMNQVVNNLFINIYTFYNNKLNYAYKVTTSSKKTPFVLIVKILLSTSELIL